MPAKPPSSAAESAAAENLSLKSSAAAIRRLAHEGYESTTAGDLADAVGMSRSTFFRRFGSKDDVVFADHDHALAELEATLETTELPAGRALVEGTVSVLRLLLHDPEAARLRFGLMRDTPTLRDRELVITHRYERVFSRYIRRVEQPGTPHWVGPALAAALVAAHNSTLRDWLRERIDDAPRSLALDLQQVTALFDRWLTPGGSEQRVLVAVYDATGSPDAVLEAVSARLGGEHA